MITAAIIPLFHTLIVTLLIVIMEMIESLRLVRTIPYLIFADLIGWIESQRRMLIGSEKIELRLRLRRPRIDVRILPADISAPITCRRFPTSQPNLRTPTSQTRFFLAAELSGVYL